MQQLDSSMFPGFPGYKEETPRRSSIKSKGGSDYSDWPGFEEEESKNLEDLLAQVERRLNLGLAVDARDMDKLIDAGMLRLPREYKRQGSQYVLSELPEFRSQVAKLSLGYSPSMTPGGEMVYGSGMGGALTGEDTRRILAMQPTGPTPEQISFVEGARGRIASRMREQDMAAAERANLELQRMADMKGLKSDSRQVESDLTSAEATQRKLRREVNKLIDLAEKEKNPAEKRRLIEAAGRIANQLTTAENTVTRLEISKANLELKENAAKLKAGATAAEVAAIDEVVAWIEENQEANPEAAAEAAKIIKDGSVKNLSARSVIASAQAITAGDIAEAGRKARDLEDTRIATEQRAEQRSARVATASDIREIEQDIAELEAKIVAAGGIVSGGEVTGYPNNPELADKIRGAEITLSGLVARLEQAQAQTGAVPGAASQLMSRSEFELAFEQQYNRRPSQSEVSKARGKYWQ